MMVQSMTIRAETLAMLFWKFYNDILNLNNNVMNIGNVMLKIGNDDY